MTSGLVVVDKPSGMTSHDVVSKARKIFRTRKIGHAGTLDPMATGVLVLGVERATKLLGHLTLTDKTYVATIRLGYATVTDDAEGSRLEGPGASNIGPDDVRTAMKDLTGTIDQVPSAVSAVKVAGRRAYDRVRSGEEVELAARTVTVTRFDLLADRRPEPDLLDLDVIVECSSGTYVRALARDLGRALGTGGHLTALRRTRVGPFTIAEARTLEQLAEAEEPVTLDLDAAVATAFPRRDVDEGEATVLGHGGRLPTTGLTGVYGVFGPDGRVVALVRERDGATRSEVVLRPSG
ncbi:tRNA pseudouridine(55) synthase TruB [Cryptosporangium phraense]|uniref:tRNA pseudouridine(55) synthase TruB n=1 Tax=Cryptosporangium phraense TaxID=2593070 RepID=UPI001F103536|nr:tRNA pseudouridine(55) synthase TruB [Cryptosporangium phraense]